MYKFLEHLEDMLGLTGSKVLQAGPHLLLEASSQPAHHHADVPTTSRQHAVAAHLVQEVPEDWKDVPLHGLRLSGVH